jgi:uncharacterized protein YjbI with pentapeptide repeats
MSVARTPTLVLLEIPLSRLIFYLLLPLATLFFAWKAAVFPRWWGTGLLCAAVAVIASHAMLRLGKVSWSKPSAALIAAIVALLLILDFGPFRRPFDLYRANLSDQLLRDEDLVGAHLAAANLTRANMTGTNLSEADLSGARLSGAHLSGASLNRARLISAKLSTADLIGAHLNGANLSGAVLSGADLAGAHLNGAHLNGANLSRAVLSGADLDGADLSGATISQHQLDKACGTDAILPPGLTTNQCQSA